MTQEAAFMRAPDFRKIVGGVCADDEYWRYLELGEFRLCRCTSCKKWLWPANFRCPACGGWDQEWVRLEPEGVIYSWTRTWYNFDRVRERAEDLPFVVVLAEIPAADNVRVIGVLTGAEEGLRIGAKVRGVFLPPQTKTKGYPSLCWKLEEGAGR